MKRAITILTAIMLLCGCSSQVSQISQSPTESALPASADSTSEAAADSTTEPVDTDSEPEAGEHPAETRTLPWSKEDYPELEAAELPEYGQPGVKMELGTYPLDDVCLWLLADDAANDGGNIRCTSLRFGLTVSGIEQDIVDAPAKLASPEGDFLISPDTLKDHLGYTSCPDAIYAVDSFSGDSAACSAYYSIRTEEISDYEKTFSLFYLGIGSGKNIIGTLSMPPEQKTGLYMFSTCPAVVSCNGAASPEEALDILAEKYFEYMLGDSPDRSFKVLEYRNITSRVIMQTIEDTNLFETWELSQNSWQVDISAEFRAEGSIQDLTIQADPEEWYTAPYGGAPPDYFLLYQDGDAWYLWSRHAYSEIPHLLG